MRGPARGRVTGELDDMPPLREVIARHGLAAKKTLGQNFLLDGNLLDRIARVPGKLDGASVYEVGPGPGGLTRALLRAGAQVTAVERDDRALPALAELADAAAGRLTVIAGDALAQDEASLLSSGTHIAANLPYNIGTALLVRWLTVEPWAPWWASLTLMFQKEVAQRIVAAPDTGAYGRLSVLAQWRSTPRIAFDLHPSAFVPPPKITSAVVHIVPTAAPAGVSGKVLESLTASAFGQRRKMLRASLRGLPGALTALEACGVDSARRAETLSVTEFVGVARVLSQR